MELSFLMLERARIDREITHLRREAAAAEAGAESDDTEQGAAVIPFERVVELQRERARVADLIASRGG